MRTLKRHNMDGGGGKAGVSAGLVGGGAGVGAGYAANTWMGVTATNSMLIGGFGAITAGLGLGYLGMKSFKDADITHQDDPVTDDPPHAIQPRSKIGGKVEEIKVIIHNKASDSDWGKINIQAFEVFDDTTFNDLDDFIHKLIARKDSNYSDWKICPSQEQLEKYEIDLASYYKSKLTARRIPKPIEPYIKLKNLFDNTSKSMRRKLDLNIRKNFKDFFGKNNKFEQSKKIELYIFNKYIENSD